MWIFPAQLRHEVLPYQTPGERISVSGNCYMNPPNQRTTYIKEKDTPQPYMGLGNPKSERKEKYEISGNG